MNDDIKNKVKKLWIDTFGDSAEYVDMIIDGYFDENTSRYIVEYGTQELISSSLVIPYEFEMYCHNDDAGNRSSGDLTGIEKISGDYLCGLATVKRRRGEGLMRNIISDIEEISMRNGSSFCFLIPADDDLRNYYKRLGYKDTCCRSLISIDKSGNSVEKTFKRPNGNSDSMDTGVYDETAESEISEIKRRLFEIAKSHIVGFNKDNIDEDIVDIIAEFCVEFEHNLLRNIRSVSDYITNETLRNIKFCRICHSRHQWRDIILDSLRDNAKIIVCVKSLNKNGCSGSNISISSLCSMKNILSDNSNILSMGILTEDNKLFPIFGYPGDLLYLLSGILFPHDDGNNHENVEKLHMYIADPVYSEMLFRNMESTEILAGCLIQRAVEKYGMAKCFGKGIDASEIVINLMFD